MAGEHMLFRHAHNALDTQCVYNTINVNNLAEWSIWTSKATGPDGIPPKLLKLAGNTLVPVLVAD